MASFSERLKTLRKKKKLTQKELAKEFKVQQGAINKWESGATEPNLATLTKIAIYFDVSLDYLMGRIETEFFPNYNVEDILNMSPEEREKNYKIALESLATLIPALEAIGMNNIETKKLLSKASTEAQKEIDEEKKNIPDNNLTTKDLKQNK